MSSDDLVVSSSGDLSFRFRRRDGNKVQQSLFFFQKNKLHLPPAEFISAVTVTGRYDKAANKFSSFPH